ncbi:type II toxin-antitoxin system VapC family toxin [Viscerimonas tarda]
MRYYLDANIVIFALSPHSRDELTDYVIDILDDSENLLYISPFAVREIIQNYNAGELKYLKYKNSKELFNDLELLNIKMLSVTKEHLIAYSHIDPYPGHKDPNDHIIIAQAISDKIPLISSDTKFKHYASQGLDFIFNRR